MKAFIIFLMVFFILPIILFISGAFFVVKQTEYCIVTEFGGKISKVYTEPGLHIKIPVYHKTFYFPARARSIDSPPEHIVTGDQKKLIIDNYVKWKISDPLKFRNRIANKSGADNFLPIAGERISIITHNALKDVLGSQLLSDIISTSRNSIAEQAQQIATIEARELGLEVIDIRIKRVEFPTINVEKVYNRMQAERYKEANYYSSRGQEKSLTIRSESDKEVTKLITEAQKDAKLIMATADAEAAKIYADSYNKDPNFYAFYRSLQALKKTVDTNTTLVISPKSDLYKYLVSP